MSLGRKIKQKALELGFDAAGITGAEPVESSDAEHFQRWLDDGCAAEMAYLHRNIDKRFDPAKLLKGARSVICVALNYRPANDEIAENPSVRIARFALYEDYHRFIKDRLFELADYIMNAGVNSSPPANGESPAGVRGLKFKACVDSVPLAERALAQRAGLGFIGRNHMLIHPELGSQILLGELITTLDLKPDEPTPDLSCGDCGRCVRACPTGALSFDGDFDARKCISYLTIEAGNATVPVADKYNCGRDARVPSYIFGCDECILACPHERNAPPRKNIDFQFHPEWQTLTRGQIQTMTDDDFQTTFARSGLIRGGLDRLKRNCGSSNFNL